MRSKVVVAFTVAAAVSAFGSAAGAASAGKFTNAQLISETLAPRPGSTIWLGIELRPKPGWHGYWSNPGDAGIPPVVKWQAPAGVTFGPLNHPAPSLIRVAGVASFVHAGPHILLVPVRIAPTVRAGTRIPIVAQLSWGSCSDSACVPERATLSLTLVPGTGAPSSQSRSLAAAKTRLPGRAPAARYVLGRSTVRLIVPGSLKLVPTRTRFFPVSSDDYDAGTARSRLIAAGTEIVTSRRGTPPATISGVVADGRRAYRISFRR